MGKGGRFGKYGEQKRLERLRQKQRDIAPFKRGKKFPEQRPMDHQKGRNIPCPSGDSVRNPPLALRQAQDERLCT